ncbi:MAG: hypothetical protein QM723_06380 [Myxococcaceae bacterium]
MCLALVLLSAACHQASSADAGPALRTAAVALRDEVPGYQQLGTEWFTVPKLDSFYSKHWYLTEKDGKHERKAFVDAVTEATRDYDAVDVFILVLGNSAYVRWMEDVPAPQRAKIRLVYNTGGGGASEASDWLRLGVHAYVAHPGNNVAPIFYVEFLKRWTEGETLDDSVDHANKYTKAKMYSTTGDVTSWAVEKVSGKKLDRAALWANTEAQIFRP